MDSAGHFNDGRSAASHPVLVRSRPGGLEIIGADGLMVAYWRTQDIRPGGELPGRKGVRLRCLADPAARLSVEDEALARQAASPPRLARRSLPGWALPLLLATGAAIVGTGLYLGIPAAARALARAMPVAWEQQIGTTMIQGLSATARPCSTPAGDAALSLLSSRLTASLPPHARPVRLLVLNSPAVNALALPGNVVVLFNGLLREAQHPDEVAGVLAHEFVHVAERHATAAALRGLGIGLVVGAMTGDASGMVAGGVAVALAGAYQRQDETAADLGAVRLLTLAGIGSEGLVQFFRRMAATHPEGLEWLSSHPDSSARAAAVNRVADARSFPASLSAEQWQDVQGICR